MTDPFANLQIDTMTEEELKFEINYADGMRMKAEDAARLAEASRHYYTELASKMRRRIAEMRKK